MNKSHNHCHDHKHCVSNALQEAKSICEKNNAQFTDIRRQVFELIWQSHQPAKAYDLLAQLAENGYSSKPPTVYRALDFLLEQGLIHKINSENAYIGCVHPIKQHPCTLLVCTQCGETSECCDEALNSRIEQLAQKNHFKLCQSDLEIRGLCTNCATN